MVKITVKQSLYSKFLFFVLPKLGQLKLMSLESACKIINHSFRNGAFKVKVGYGKWKNMKLPEFEVERK